MDARLDALCTLRPALLTYVRHRTRNADDAEDVVQRAYLNACRAWPRYQQHHGGNGWAWLRTIADNLIKNRARDTSRQPIVLSLGEWHDRAGSDAEREALARVDLAAVASAIRTLIPPHQQAIAQAVAGVSLGRDHAAEAARRKGTLHRARKALRKAL